MIDQLQDYLSRAQACPIMGPLAVSPVKAAVSSGQLMFGAAIAIFCIMIWLYHGCQENKERERTSQGVSNFGWGLLHLIYTILNVITLGIFGLMFEACRPNTTSKF